MLYNKNWDKPQHNPLSMKAVIAWLETKDPDEEYHYHNSGTCLAAQYNDSISRIYEVPAPFYILLPWWLRGFDSKLESIASARPYTFGAALERAKGR